MIDETLDAMADAPEAVAEGLGIAEVWARMAASHGAIVDVRRLVAVLMVRANYERSIGADDLADSVDAEAIGLLDVLAEAGDENAGAALASCGDYMPAGAFARLREIQACAA
ncbi:hypothetical protein ASG11_09915 [Sphingomonas sp. Leaf357]|nr:hypothetical protein ASG11_09915 [Sphingomonas sp. Leaf357]